MNKQKFEKDNQEFVSEVSGLSVEQLDARLAQLAKDIKAVDDAKEADEGLATAKETAKELGAPYREAKKALREKSDYLVSLVVGK